MARPIRDKAPIPEKPISIRLHKPVREKLIELAKYQGVSPAELIRRIVTDSLMGEGKYLELIGEQNND